MVDPLLSTCSKDNNRGAPVSKAHQPHTPATVAPTVEWLGGDARDADVARKLLPQPDS